MVFTSEFDVSEFRREGLNIDASITVKGKDFLIQDSYSQVEYQKDVPDNMWEIFLENL